MQQALDDFVALQLPELAAVGEELAPLADALVQLVAGGKRLRPAFCYWGFLGAGGDDGEPIVAAAAALELFQACALIHDDVMDGSDTRRGRPAAHRSFAALHRGSGWQGDPEAFGTGAAILLGDLCLVWSDEMLARSGFSDHELARADRVFATMRSELMGGQYLDLLEQARGGGSVERARRVARYKSAKYTIERPLHLGAALAGAGQDLLDAYTAYGMPLGEAFQLRDDLLGVFGDPDAHRQAGRRRPARGQADRARRDGAGGRRPGARTSWCGATSATRTCRPRASPRCATVLVDTGAVAEVERLIDRRSPPSRSRPSSGRRSRSRPARCSASWPRPPPPARSDPGTATGRAGACRLGWTGDCPDPRRERPLLVRQRPQVQALPPPRRRRPRPGRGRAVPARAGRGRGRPLGAARPAVAASRGAGGPSPAPTTSATGTAARATAGSAAPKTPDEIERMRRAGRAAAEVLAEVGAAVRPGITTDELDAICHAACIARGGYPSPLGYNGFPKSLCTSVNEVICHGIPDSTVLKDGDIVNLDVTIFLDGVHGDTNATFFVGEVDEQSRRLVEVTRRVPGPRHRRGPTRRHGPRHRPGDPGARGGARATASSAASSGTASARRSTPSRRSTTTTTRRPGRVLEPGMTFTIEPMITIGDPPARPVGRRLDGRHQGPLADRAVRAHAARHRRRRRDPHPLLTAGPGTTTPAAAAAGVGSSSAAPDRARGVTLNGC